MGAYETNLADGNYNEHNHSFALRVKVYLISNLSVHEIQEKKLLLAMILE